MKCLAEQGNAEAQCNLGCCYLYGEGISSDKNKATEWFTKAVEQDSTKAQYYLGYCYDNGVGVSEDKSKAVELYVKAAECGHAEAQNVLRKKKIRFKVKRNPMHSKRSLSTWIIGIICCVMCLILIVYLLNKFPQLWRYIEVVLAFLAIVIGFLHVF